MNIIAVAADGINMKATARKDIKLKNGPVIITAGSCVEVLPPSKEKPWICFVVVGIEEQYKLSTAKLGHFFKEFETISMADLQEAVMDGTCDSMTGQVVEPDGWDQKGFPSKLLAAGMI